MPMRAAASCAPDLRPLAPTPRGVRRSVPAVRRARRCTAACAALLLSVGACAPTLSTGYTLRYARSAELMMSPAWDGLGLTGRGVKVGSIDEGFRGWREEPLTRDLRVEAARNFVTGDTVGFFGRGPAHGMWVARNFGGRNGTEAWGLASKATYYLALTEEPEREVPAEEVRLTQAIAWVVSQGVRVINVSLGYSKFDAPHASYTDQDLYRDRTFSARFLDSPLAARPEVNVIVAAGNDGMRNPGYILTPADARRVITVGSVTSGGTSRVINSSRGIVGAPYIKPDLMTYPNIGGTSFAAPAIAGLVAQLLEANPALTNSEVADLLRRSGSRADSPNVETGYGVPQTARLLALVRAMSPR